MPSLETITTVNNYIIGLNNESLSPIKITHIQNQRAHELLKQSKITFSVEIVVEQDKVILHPQAATPPIFRVRTNQSTFACQEINHKFDRLSSIIHTLDFLTHVRKFSKFNFHVA